MFTEEQHSRIMVTMEELIIFNINNRSGKVLQVDHCTGQYCTAVTGGKLTHNILYNLSGTIFCKDKSEMIFVIPLFQ